MAGRRGRPPGSGEPAWWAEARRLHRELGLNATEIAEQLEKHRTSVATALFALNRKVRNRNARKYRRRGREQQPAC